MIGRCRMQRRARSAYVERYLFHDGWNKYRTNSATSTTLIHVVEPFTGAPGNVSKIKFKKQVRSSLGQCEEWGDSAAAVQKPTHNTHAPTPIPMRTAS